MSKSQRPFRSTFFTLALVSIIGVSFLSIAVAGTSAAGFSIVDSVSSFFALQSESPNTIDAERGARAERIPLDVPLHVYGTGWLRVAEQSLETNGPGLGTTESVGKDDLDGFDCTSIPAKGIDRQENMRAGRIMIHCGLAEGGSAEEGEEGEAPGKGSGPLAFGATDVNAITGAETNPSVTQSETYILANPDNANQVVIAYNDSRTAPSNYSGASFSTDGGATFTRLTPNPFTTGHGTNFGDPVVLYHRPTSSFFTVWLATGCGGQGLGAWKSTDGGQTWAVGACIHNGGQDDRESGWSDNNPASPFYGTMYVSYNDFNIGGGSLRVHRSTDGGATWSAAVQLTAGFIRNTQITGDFTNGDVYVAGMDEGGGGFPHTNINKLYRSTDGGVTVYQHV
jgi:hypothetical protein